MFIFFFLICLTRLSWNVQGHLSCDTGDLPPHSLPLLTLIYHIPFVFSFPPSSRLSPYPFHYLQSPSTHTHTPPHSIIPLINIPPLHSYPTTIHTPGHTAIGVICDGLTIFEKTAGKPKKLNTLRKLPADLLNSMDSVSTPLSVLTNIVKCTNYVACSCRSDQPHPALPYPALPCPCPWLTLPCSCLTWPHSVSPYDRHINSPSSVRIIPTKT